VRKEIHDDVLLENEGEAEDRAEDQGFSIPDKAILEVLEMMPFASIRQIAQMTSIPLTTGFRRLRKSSLCTEAIALGSPQTLGSSKTGLVHRAKEVTQAASVHKTSVAEI
jgi:hypothetical protein